MSGVTFTALKQDIEEIVKKSPLEFDVAHAQHVLVWVLKLRPGASEALQIAALAHDMERGATGITETYNLKDLSNLKEFKQAHAKRSADIIARLMRKHGYSEHEIARVYFLVEHHEEGGSQDEELNTLTDADSIAYFAGHIGSYYEKNGKTKTADKVRFMYTRMSKAAQQVVRGLTYTDPEVAAIVVGVTSEADFI